MKSFNKSIGYEGEHLGKEYLKRKGYKILNCNYSNFYGEIDLICTKNNILIFVEVKSRYSKKNGMPLEAVTSLKRRKIKQTALLYIIKNKLLNYNVRFDIIEIFFNYYDSTYNINHIEDAFR